MSIRACSGGRSACGTGTPVDEVAQEQVALLRRRPEPGKDAQQHAVVAMEVAHDDRVRGDVQQRRLSEQTTPARTASQGSDLAQAAAGCTAACWRWKGGGSLRSADVPIEHC